MLALSLLAILLLASAGLSLATSRAQPPPAPSDRRAAPARVSIIIPARDEAHNLPRLLRSLERIDHEDLEVIVVDGGSRDATADIAQAFAARDPRVRLIHEPPLPRGWVGKCWACWRGRQSATGEWLLFTDADTFHEPDSLSRVLAFAQAEDADFVTGLSWQELGSFGERVAMPPTFTLIQAATGGSGEATFSDPARAIANGQYMLWRAEAYDALGGHEAVAGSIVEDLALARLAAARGVRGRFIDLGRLVGVRMYSGWRSMLAGWRKNVATGARETPPREFVLTASTQFAGTMALPLTIAALVAGAPVAATAGALSYVIMTWRVRRAHAGSEGAGWLHAALHPAGYAFFLVALVVSAWDRASGRGTTWKGRRYTPRA